MSEGHNQVRAITRFFISSSGTTIQSAGFDVRAVVGGCSRAWFFRNLIVATGTGPDRDKTTAEPLQIVAVEDASSSIRSRSIEIICNCRKQQLHIYPLAI